MISSNWKMTYDPDGSALVLLDFGDLIDDEPRFAFSTGLDVVALVDSASPFLRATGNGVYEISFRRLLAAASDQAARGAALDWLASNDALAKAPLKIEMLEGTYATYQFSGAVITRHETQRLVASRSARYSLDIALTAAGLSRTYLGGTQWQSIATQWPQL